MRALIVFFLALAPSVVIAWGGRGHHSICSAATHLVKEKGLRAFLREKAHVMGHLCNVPDIYWKSLPDARSGNPGHYINPQITGLAIKDLGLDFGVLEKQFTGQPNRHDSKRIIGSLSSDMGTLWWRADQFYRRVVARADAMAKIEKPSKSKEQDDDFPYNREIYDMFVNMGLMGHFVGDASMPLHNWTDHDGWDKGHGGLHKFYEEDSVGAAPGDLEARIIATAEKMRDGPWIDGKSVLERMRAFSDLSASEAPKLYEKDPVRKKSIEKNEGGLKLRTPAERESTEVGWKRFSPLIVPQMARSAKLLAKFWDEAYVAIGRPDLSGYESFRHPFTPDFVPPDYIPSKDSK